MQRKGIGYMGVNNMSPQSGRMLKENDQVVNKADMLEAIYNALVVNKNAGVAISGSLSNVIGSKNIVTAGTRVQLATDQSCREVFIKAKRGNTGYIYIGNNTASSTVFGNDLAANESMTIQVANLNQIYLDASVSGEGVTFIAI